MAIATIKLVNADKMMQFYMGSDQVATARKLLAEDAYTTQGFVEVYGFEGEDVAEEIFDLTNNPSRQDEREMRYGQRHRSVSVGDVVRVGSDAFLCASFGWGKI